MIRKLSLAVCGILFLVFLLSPWYLYHRSLSLLISYPEPTVVSDLSQSELEAYWKTIEPKADIESLGSSTPYWFYSWLVAAISNDYFDFQIVDPYAQASVMTSQIALNHMSSGVRSNAKHSMLWRHLLHASLSIYIQRSWSAKEIVNTHKAIDF